MTAPPQGRDLRVAIAVGVLLAALFVGTLAWHPYAFLSFVAVVVVVALLELDTVLRARGTTPATPVAIVAGLTMLYGAYARGAGGQLLGLAVLLVGGVGWLEGRWWRRPVPPQRAAAELGVTALVGLWVPFLASHLGLLLAREDGVAYVTVTVALTVVSDVGGFAVGSALGRRRMAPSISPGKTWEGFAGGLAAVLVAALAVPAALPALGLGAALALGLVVCVAATLGDLAESLVKRDLGVKDLGTILPGHGGIMDRIDAMIFAVPAVHMLLLAIGI
jgi:phosphatidate cytidylyltransferase